jgi:cathepsin B
MKKILVIAALTALLATFVYVSTQEQKTSAYSVEGATPYAEYLATLADQVNNAQTSWKAKPYDRWAKMTDKSIKRLLGALETPEHVLKTFPVVDTIVDTIPASFNASVQWPSCASIGEIRDQANCGSCWAFAAAEAMTDRWCIASNQQTNPRISMENLLTCCSSCGYGCNGGYPILAWEYWSQTGLVSGDGYGALQWCQPYFIPSCGLNCPGTEEVAPACSTQCAPGYTGSVPYAQDFFLGSSAYQVAANVAAIQTEIMTNGPVEAQFNVYEDFYQYTSGVYVHTTGQYLGGHAIKILGWGTLNGQAYWTVANSWSPAWGMNGFFLILRGVNECGIESGVVGGLPNLA